MSDIEKGWYCVKCGWHSVPTPPVSTVDDTLRRGVCRQENEARVFKYREPYEQVTLDDLIHEPIKVDVAPDPAPEEESRFEGPVVTNPDPHSQAAAKSVEPTAPGARRKVWDLIAEHPTGLACWEVEELTGGLHQSVSATINWLHNHKMLVRKGVNRTPTGRRAYIYHAVQP